jgi:hypothetical protein
MTYDRRQKAIELAVCREVTVGGSSCCLPLGFAEGGYFT